MLCLNAPFNWKFTSLHQLCAWCAANWKAVTWSTAKHFCARDDIFPYVFDIQCHCSMQDDAVSYQKSAYRWPIKHWELLHQFWTLNFLCAFFESKSPHATNRRTDIGARSVMRPIINDWLTEQIRLTHLAWVQATELLQFLHLRTRLRPVRRSCESSPLAHVRWSTSACKTWFPLFCSEVAKYKHNVHFDSLIVTAGCSRDDVQAYYST